LRAASGPSLRSDAKYYDEMEVEEENEGQNLSGDEDNGKHWKGIVSMSFSTHCSSLYY
jgi:hypothetical protein